MNYEVTSNSNELREMEEFIIFPENGLINIFDEEEIHIFESISFVRDIGLNGFEDGIFGECEDIFFSMCVFIFFDESDG